MRLMIVDDDFQIREGMRQAIDWRRQGIDDVVTCGDAVEVIKAYGERRPDIILLDIQMPEMTGLEIAKRIREQDVETRIIFVTAYSDFDYCQQALQMGANDFILKPVRGETLKAVIANNIREINKRREKESVYQSAVLDRLVKDLYQHQKKEKGSELIEVLKRHYREFEGNYFITLTLQFEEEKYIDDPAYQEKWNRFCRKLLADNRAVILPHFSNGYIGLAIGSNSMIENMNFKYRLKLAVDVWNGEAERDNYALIAGISAAHTASELLEGYREAVLAMEQHFYTGNRVNVFVFADSKAKKEAEFKVEMQELKEAIWAFQYESIQQILHGLTAAAEEKRIRPERFRRECLKIYRELARAVKIPDSMEIIQAEMEGCRTASECFDVLKHHIKEEIWKGNQRNCFQMGNEKHSALVEQALEYLLEHFSDTVSVKEVAEACGKTPNYFSAVFKKEMGISFMDYLTRMRMEKARSLLLYTNKKIQDISLEVGYADYPYFSKLFKKITGCSASEIRKNNPIQS